VFFFCEIDIMHLVWLCFEPTKWLTLWSQLLLVKSPVTQLLKNFPTLYGIWRFITAFTGACHWLCFEHLV
jgi:hypothetical protein